METRSNHVLVGAVVLILLAVTALFTVWLARLNSVADKEFDILFQQAVDGIAKGSPVVFSGVPAGQVQEIALYKPDPAFVRVRISVNQDTPVLEGTVATIQGIGFTGVSQIQLDGAVKGAPPIKCPDANPQAACPLGVPLIPTKQGGISALLSSAPALLDRLTTLTERLGELLSDDNQKSIGAILDNTNRLSGALADRGPEIAATIAEMRGAIKQAGNAAEQAGNLAESTDKLVSGSVKPTLDKLNDTIESAQRSMVALEGTLGDTRPAIQSVTRTTIPEINRLISDLRETSANLNALTTKINQQGATSILSSPALPDYDPKKGK